MGCRHRLILLCATLVASAGCHHGDSDNAPSDAGALSSSPAPSASARADQLASNELVEGADHAFGLAIPLLMKVNLRLGLTVSAQGRVPQKLLVTYVQKRVASGSAEIGSKDATFTDVRALTDPARPLNIHVYSDINDGETLMDVKDATPTPVDPIPPEEAWKRNGITPNNKIIDPLQLR